MITPHYAPWSRRCWAWYISYLISRNFSSFSYHGEVSLAAGRPLLVLSNHFSWWDGFFIYHLNEKLLGKKFYVMMLEEQLHKHRILRSAGAFSVNKQSRSLLTSLHFAASLLESPENMVLIFPQGRLESLYCQSPGFEKGVLRILSQSHPPPQVLMVNTMVDYFSNRRPEVSLCLKMYDPGAGEDLRQAFTNHYAESRSRQGNRFG